MAADAPTWVFHEEHVRVYHLTINTAALETSMAGKREEARSFHSF